MGEPKKEENKPVWEWDSDEHSGPMLDSNVCDLLNCHDWQLQSFFWSYLGCSHTQNLVQATLIWVRLLRNLRYNSFHNATRLDCTQVLPMSYDCLLAYWDTKSYTPDVEISRLVSNLQIGEFRGAQAQEAPDGSPIHPSMLRLVPRPREVNSQYRGFGNSISCISNECL